jgi:hypothetical protein
VSPEHLHVLVEEVWLNATVSIGEYVAMLHLLKLEETRQHRAVWVRAQAFLTHAAMTSKFLFPPSRKGFAKRRGALLRDHLAVGDESPLKARTARDAAEHFDERLDAWIASEAHGLLEAVLQDRNALAYLGDGWSIRRVLLLDEMVLVTPGRDGKGRDEVELRPIADALTQIIDACEARFATSDPYDYVGPRLQ